MTRVNHPHIDKTKVLSLLIPMLEENNAPSNIYDIISSKRNADLVYSRALVAFILRQSGFTFSQIGYILNRDHTAVIYLVGKWKNSGASTNNMAQKYYFSEQYKNAIKKLKHLSVKVHHQTSISISEN